MNDRPASTDNSPLRVAIISTPRAGNTWLRYLIGHVWSLEQVAVHELPEDAWAKLPAECVLQVHRPRESDFVQRLEREGFRVITLARHPFDVLISILHVSIYGVESERWLGGLHGDETSLWGAMPHSQAFRDYAAGPRAAALIQVTNSWWQSADAISLKYEELVRDPAAILRGLEPSLGPPRGARIERAIELSSMATLRKQTGVAQHFWLGQPGLWKELIASAEARQMASALRPTFETLGYACDPDPGLTELQADHNWVRYFGRELRQTLDRSTELHHRQIWEIQQRLLESIAAQKDWETRYKAQTAFLNQVESVRDQALVDIVHLRGDLFTASNRLKFIEGCGRFSLRAACAVQACLNRLPMIHQAGKWLMRLPRRLTRRSRNRQSDRVKELPTTTISASTIPSHAEQLS